MYDEMKEGSISVANIFNI